MAAKERGLTLGSRARAMVARACARALTLPPSPRRRSFVFTAETGGIDAAAMDDENEARLKASGVS